MESANHRVYVAPQTQMDVVDLTTGKLQGARTMDVDATTGTVYVVGAKLTSHTPAPTPEVTPPRPNPMPGTFTVMVVGR